MNKIFYEMIVSGKQKAYRKSPTKLIESYRSTISLVEFILEVTKVIKVCALS